MVRLLEYPLEAGDSMLIHGEDGPSADAEVTRGWADRDRCVVEQARESFELAVARVQPAVQGLVQQSRSSADNPDAISVEFGLELSAEVGAVVAGASTKGNFKVSMTWNRRSRSDGT